MVRSPRRARTSLGSRTDLVRLRRPLWRSTVVTSLLVAFVVFDQTPVLAEGRSVSQFTIQGAADLDSDRDGTPDRPDTADASLAARQLGERVEDLSERTSTTEVFANADGTWTTEQSAGPVRAQDPQTGKWRPIDTALVETADGWVPKSVPAPIAFSGGGRDPLVSMADIDGQQISWTWPTKLPAPTVKGSTLTYRNVVSHGDLVVEALPSGFSHSVILRRAPSAPLSIPMIVDTGGAKLTVGATNSISITRGGSTLVTAPAPTMSDGSAGRGSAAVPVDVKLRGGSQNRIVLLPDQRYLTNHRTTYPVTIDPTFSYNFGQSGSIRTDSEWATAPSWLNVGSTDLPGWPAFGEPYGLYSYLYFRPIVSYASRDIYSATLSMFSEEQTTDSCDPLTISVRRVTENWLDAEPEPSWEFPGPDATSDDESSVSQPANGGPYESECADPGSNEWDVTNIVQAWADGAVDYGLQIAPASMNAEEIRSYSNVINPTTLSITMSGDPDAPPTMPTILVSPMSEGDVTALNPTVTVHVEDPDSTYLHVNATLWTEDGSASLWTYDVDASSGDTLQDIPIDDEALEIGAHYELTVIVDDGLESSSATLDFQVNPGAATFPETTCGSGCTPVAPEAAWLDDDLSPGERRIVSLDGVVADADEMDQVNFNLAIDGWPADTWGYLQVYDADTPEPTGGRVSWLESDLAGVQATGTVELSTNDEHPNSVVVYNPTNSTVHAMLTVTGLWPWYDSDEQDLEDLVENPTTDVPEEGTEPGPVEVPDDDPEDPEALHAVGLRKSDVALDTSLTIDGKTVRVHCSEPTGTGHKQLCFGKPRPTEEESGHAGIGERRREEASLGLCASENVWSVVRFSGCINAVIPVVFTTDGVPTGEATIEFSEELTMNNLTSVVQHDLYLRWIEGTGDLSGGLQIDGTYECLGPRCAIGYPGSTFFVPIGPGAENHHLVTEVVSTPLSAGNARADILQLVTSLSGSAGGGVSAKIGILKTPQFVCDNAPGLPGSGCTFNQWSPVFTMLYNGGAPKTAAHIRKAQGNGYSIILRRHFWGSSPNLNRRDARTQCRQLRQSSCDEYPFASTEEGCRLAKRALTGPGVTTGRWCSTAGIPIADNRYGGSLLGAFYRRWRIRPFNFTQLDSDQFIVVATSPITNT